MTGSTSGDPGASAAVRSLKADLRKRILAAREALDAAKRREAGARITAKLLALPSYRDAAVVSAYIGFGSELDTGAFVADLLRRGKRLALPRVDKPTRSLKLHAVRDVATELASGVWGIREPRPDLCPELSPREIDFVLVPGVAFTERCERLGYGGGFYDRLIRELDGRAALAVGAFGMQVVAELPMTPTDQRVDLVISEDAEYQRRDWPPVTSP